MYTPDRIANMTHEEFKAAEKALTREADANLRKKLRTAGFNIPTHSDDRAERENENPGERENTGENTAAGSTAAPAEEEPIPDYLSAPVWDPIPANIPADARKLIEDARIAANAALAEARGLYRAWKRR